MFRPPLREYLLIGLVGAALVGNFLAPAFFSLNVFLWFIAFLGALPTAWDAMDCIFKRRITIDAFNFFAIIVSFATEEIRSAAFIVLMLAFARLLDWRTASRTKDAVRELLLLKPEKAMRIRHGTQGDTTEEIHVEDIKKGDILLAEDGDRIAADGFVVFGKASVNESSVTGESVPVEKREGDRLISGTLIESGTVKFRATRVGEDSTIERMAALVREAQKNKSHSEKLADRFSAIFMPIVLAVGVLVYLFTHNILMTAALFLVACADDIAVAIPLAMTAALGRAAEKGVIVKGGEWLDALQAAQTLVLDKTGTLTFGSFELREADIAGEVTPEGFWRSVAVAEKFSEHPVGRAIFSAAAKKMEELAPGHALPDPDEVKIHEGKGIWVRYGGLRRSEVAIGDPQMCAALGIDLDEAATDQLKEKEERFGGTSVLVFINKRFAGIITVADVPRPEAAASMQTLRASGLGNIVMFTGDNDKVAARVAGQLGIASYMAGMLPDDKMRRLAEFDPPVVMVGDGVNDAPALARADVGIAMGSGGAAVAVEAADIVILTDNLSRIPEMIFLGKQTLSVIKWDMLIWVVTNIVGFGLVLTGLAGPAFAAFYNFATDFLPLANSARLFTKS